MLVFISWSGQQSKAVAEALENWLAQVIQAVEPWISQDIDKGLRWGAEIADRLERSKVGIICLTKSNLGARWIHYEAGALSKTKDAYVCTLLLDLKPSDVEQPLAQFQHTTTEKEQIFKLLSTINDVVQTSGEKALPEGRLREVFETYWPRLEKAFQESATHQESVATPSRTGNEMLQEILEILRNNERRRSHYEPQMEAIFQLLQKHQIVPNMSLESAEALAQEYDESPLTVGEAIILNILEISNESLSLIEIDIKAKNFLSKNIVRMSLRSLLKKGLVEKIFYHDEVNQRPIAKYRSALLKNIVVKDDKENL